MIDFPKTAPVEQAPAVRRDGAVDLVKALAICAVLMIHCSAGYPAGYETGCRRWAAAVFYACVSRWAVPAFLICSGALMNDPGRDVSLKRLFSKYLLRLAAAFTAWAVFYEGFRIVIRTDPTPVGELLRGAARNLFYGTTYYHLYYFWFAFALYLALPLTRLAARHGSETEIRYLLLLWLVCGGVIRSFQYFWPLSQMKSSWMRFSIPVMVICPGLGLLGWYMRTHPPKNWLGGAGLFAAGFAATMGGTWLRSIRGGALDTMFLDGFCLFSLMMAAGVFRVCQWIAGRWRKTPGIVAVVSGGSFCVYLVHPVFQYYVKQGPLQEAAVYWAVPVMVLVLLALSLAVYEVLKRIPGVGRWLI